VIALERASKPPSSSLRASTKSLAGATARHPTAGLADSEFRRTMGNQNLSRLLQTGGASPTLLRCGSSPCSPGGCAPTVESAEGPGLEKAPLSVHRVLNSPGQALPSTTLDYMESLFGQGLGHVRVHTGSQARQSVRAVGARAYTVGSDVVLGDSEPSIARLEDRAVLAHELTHVVQQRGDATRSAGGKLAIARQSDPLESQAQQVAKLFAGKRDVSSPTVGSGLRTLQRDTGGQAAPTPPTVFEHNTELGGLSVGNFDFHFRNCGILVWVWIKFKFSSDITAAEQADFKVRFFDSIHSVWANSGWHLTGTGHCACGTIPIVIHAEENTKSYYHKLVDVERKSDEDRRPKVISDINVNLDTDGLTLAHEFGHVLGLYDEYTGPWFENIMFWHKNVDDKSALMSQGTKLRPRYFEQYGRRVQETAGIGCTYTVSSPTPPL
jgi:Zn-dependent peptidase ImmA (M78 family)